MLRVESGFYEIEVRFDHKWCGPNEIKKLVGICVDENRRCSLATISLNGSQNSVGMSVCHPVDNFCRATGRKKALAYALKTFSKELRTDVWREYKIMCGF